MFENIHRPGGGSSSSSSINLIPVPSTQHQSPPVPSTSSLQVVSSSSPGPKPLPRPLLNSIVVHQLGRPAAATASPQQQQIILQRLNFSSTSTITTTSKNGSLAISTQPSLVVPVGGPPGLAGVKTVTRTTLLPRQSAQPVAATAAVSSSSYSDAQINSILQQMVPEAPRAETLTAAGQEQAKAAAAAAVSSLEVAARQLGQKTPPAEPPQQPQQQPTTSHEPVIQPLDLQLLEEGGEEEEEAAAALFPKKQSFWNSSQKGQKQSFWDLNLNRFKMQTESSENEGQQTGEALNLVHNCIVLFPIPSV